MNPRLLMPAIFIALALLFSAVPVNAFPGPEEKFNERQAFIGPKERFKEKPAFIKFSEGFKGLREKFLERFSEKKKLRERLLEKKGAFKEKRENFLGALNKWKKSTAFKRKQFRPVFLQDSKEMLEQRIERLISWIEAAEDKGISIEDSDGLISQLNELKERLSVESLSLNEAIEIEKELNGLWRKARPFALQRVSERFLHQFQGILKQADKAAEKAEWRLNQLSGLGGDTTALKPMLSEFKEAIESVRNALDSAQQAIDNASTPEEKTIALREANSLLKEAHKDLKQAFKDFRKFFIQYRNAIRGPN